MIRTLVVDDDYHVAHAHALSVGRVPGFSVTGEAHSAEEARLLIKDERPDLLLLDMYLPDYSGLDLVRRLTSESTGSAGPDAPGHVPDFLLVTAARDIESVRSAMQLGAIYYLVKPFTFAALREQLESYRQWRQRLERSPEADQGTVDALYGLLRSPAGTSATRRNLPPTMARVLDIVRVLVDAVGRSRCCPASWGEPPDSATLPRDTGPEAGDRPRPRLWDNRATRAPLPGPLAPTLTFGAEPSDVVHVRRRNARARRAS